MLCTRVAATVDVVVAEIPGFAGNDRPPVQLFYLARIMGTSVAQIDATYGHLLPDSEDSLRALLDDYDTAATAAGTPLVVGLLPPR